MRSVFSREAPSGNSVPCASAAIGPTPGGIAATLFQGIDEHAADAPALRKLGDRAALHPAAHRPPKAEAVNRVRPQKFCRAFGANSTGEDLDVPAALRELIGEVGHQGFDAAEVWTEALRGDDDQNRNLSSQADTAAITGRAEACPHSVERRNPTAELPPGLRLKVEAWTIRTMDRTSVMIGKRYRTGRANAIRTQEPWLNKT